MKKLPVLFLFFLAAASSYAYSFEFQKQKIETKKILLDGRHQIVRLRLKGEAELRISIKGVGAEAKLLYKWRIRGLAGNFFGWKEDTEPYPDADLQSLKKGFLSETWKFHNDDDELWRVMRASVLKDVLHVRYTVYEVIRDCKRRDSD